MKYIEESQVRENVVSVSFAERVFLITGASLVVVACVVLPIGAEEIKPLLGIFFGVSVVIINIRLWRIITEGLAGELTGSAHRVWNRIKVFLALSAKLLLLGFTVLFLLQGGGAIQNYFLIGFISIILLGSGVLILLAFLRQSRAPTEG